MSKEMKAQLVIMAEEMEAKLAVMVEEVRAQLAVRDEEMKVPLTMLASLIHYVQERDNVHIDPDGTIYHRSCDKCLTFKACKVTGLPCADWMPMIK
jgi:hypothetical protein